MARVSTSDVKALLIGSELTDEQVEPFIETANVVVTNHCAGYSYDADVLKQIELWLSAHFVCQADPQISREGVEGGTNVTYDGKTGMNLDSTRYGQQVKILDYKGTIREARKEPSLDVMMDE